MKKLVFVVIATMGMLLSVNAQSIKFGVKAGANFAGFNGDMEDTKIKTAFHVGAVAEFMISDHFSFQPELLYSSQGSKQEVSEGPGATNTVTYKLDYLNLPLMGKYYLTEAFSIQAGPQIGYLLSSDVEIDNPEVILGDFLYKKIDFGVNLGLGYKLPSGLFVDARYNLGLANINDDPDDDSKWKNGVIQVAVGYTF